MRKPKLLTIQPYGKTILVFSCNSKKNKEINPSLFKKIFEGHPFYSDDKYYFDSYIKGVSGNDLKGRSGLAYCLEGGHSIVIFDEHIVNKKNIPNLVNIVAHEMTHVYTNIADCVGLETRRKEDHSVVNDEHQAYLMGYISGLCADYLINEKII